MSAIAGIFHGDGAPIDLARLKIIASPPPDYRTASVTVWDAPGIGLAHATAADNSMTHQQPLVDSASGCVITFEGRLDNRAELAEALAEYARLIDRQSDAAYALAAFLRWGAGCAQHIIGDFVFAIWDARARSAKLFLARDPLGQRPLYYSQTDNHFAFASTLEQLLRDRNVPHEIDDEIIPYYVYAYGGLNEATPYRAIRQLPGGSYLIADANQIHVENYWQWQTEPPAPRALTDDDVSEFRARFAEAVRCRVSKDLPTGLLLSGGLDSGSVASMAGHLHAHTGSPQVHAYSFVFEKFSECDERAYIESAVARYGFPHIQVLVDDCWTFSRLDPWQSVFSEPYFAPYDPMFYKTLAQARTDGMRVMLMGHGGDALLDGSPRYLADWLLAGRWHEVHRQARAYAAASKRPYAVGLVGNALSPLFPTWARRAIEFRHAPRLKSLIPKKLRDLGFDAPPALHRGRNAWWYNFRDQLNFGQSPHEAYLDRLMRLFGMEICQPFADVRLIQFILALPPNATYADGTHRVILRRALHDILPPEIRDRRSKASFAPLMDYGLRARQKFVQALLHDSELARRGIIVEREWQRALQNYFHGTQPLYYVYWHSLVTEIWLRIQTGRLPELGQ